MLQLREPDGVGLKPTLATVHSPPQLVYLSTDRPTDVPTYVSTGVPRCIYRPTCLLSYPPMISTLPLLFTRFFSRLWRKAQGRALGVHGNPQCEGRRPGVARTGRLQQAACSVERERQTVRTVRERETIFDEFMSAVLRRSSSCARDT